MATKYDQDDLDMLTEEERAALLADDDEPQPEPELVDPKPEPAPEEPKPEPAPAPAEPTPPADPEPAPAPVEPQPAPATPAVPQPVFVAEAPADADTKLKELETRRAEAKAQYNDGTIDFDAYEAIKDQIADERLTITLAVQQADLAAKMALQQAQNAWYATANQFANNHGYDANPILYKAFEGVVVSVAQSEEGQGMSAVQILEAAHQQMVAAGLGKAAPAAAPAAQPAKAKKEQAPQPPNLATVPAAQGTETDGGNRFAHLHRLKGDALEDAIDRLSARDREEWLAQG